MKALVANWALGAKTPLPERELLLCARPDERSHVLLREGIAHWAGRGHWPPAAARTKESTVAVAAVAVAVVVVVVAAAVAAAVVAVVVAAAAAALRNDSTWERSSGRWQWRLRHYTAPGGHTTLMHLSPE